jgi:predicted CoA-binding protein
MKAHAGQTPYPEELSRDLVYVIYGVSRSERGFGYQVAEAMSKRGFTIFVIHPDSDQIGPWYTKRHVTELHPKPDVALLCSPAGSSADILAELHEAGVKQVVAWKDSIDDAGMAFARKHRIELWADCPLLHVKGIGFPHNLHRGLHQLFGSDN